MRAPFFAAYQILKVDDFFSHLIGPSGIGSKQNFKEGKRLCVTRLRTGNNKILIHYAMEI